MTKRYILLALCMGLLLSQLQAQGIGMPSPPKRETRAVWLTTYGGLDWPKNKAVDAAGVEAQKEELRRILDRVKEANLNTVLLQTRVRGSVIYPSAIEPWDGCLTGTAGRAPGYDPLAFAVEECHKRGLELHAWLVAIPCFRVSAARRAGAKSVLNTHRDLCVRHGDSWYLDPGVPGTAAYLASICREIAAGYDVDGIHFDYIRYPEHAGRFNDRASYRKYGGGASKADWRRGNITRCVREMYQSIKAVKPWVKVSSSPIGKFSDLSRYSSYAWNAYAAVYQDAQGWLREGIQDLLFPMMYFRDNHFYPFALDWKENDCGRPVVPGLGIYMLGPKEQDWPLTDVTRELYFVRAIGLGGQAYFRYAHLDGNLKGLFDFLKEMYYPFPSLPAEVAAADSFPPASPGRLRGCREASRYVLRWDSAATASRNGGVRYNVYASRAVPADVASAENLVAAGLDSCSFPVDGVFCALNDVHFAVTAMDRFGRESAPVRFSAGLSGGSESFEGFLPHASDTLSVPLQDTPYLAVVDLYGRIVATAPYSRRLSIARLPRGVYQLRTLGKEGRSVGIGYFVK